MTQSTRMMLSCVALGGALLAPTVARADHGEEALARLFYLMYGGSLIVVGGGITAAVGNGVEIGAGRRPSLGWRITGYIFAGLNLGLGALYLGITEGTNWPLSVPHLLLGALDLGLTIWGSTIPEKGGPKVTLSPFVTADATGRPSFGAALQIVSF